MTNLGLNSLNVVTCYCHHNVMGGAEYHQPQHLPYRIAHHWLTHALAETFLPTVLLYGMVGTWEDERGQFYAPVRSLLYSKNQEINRLQLAVKSPWAIFFESVVEFGVSFSYMFSHSKIKNEMKATRGLLATDHVILNHGQVTWTTPELAPPSPNYHTTPTGGRFSSRQN
ncbi:hypothetical protein TNCV_4942881 [Trichonephila clavipes]|nr:hypothetical protein TNCV_4942881 [Trichonephila clavipes]